MTQQVENQVSLAYRYSVELGSIDCEMNSDFNEVPKNWKTINVQVTERSENAIHGLVASL